MKFEIHKNSIVQPSFRVDEVMQNFDIKAEHLNETFTGEIPIENQNWKIGLIVGGSGTGKSTIAKHLFKDAYINGFDYDDRAVLDNVSADKSTHEIELAFTSVGFSSPPQWLKPYNVLSTGEKMRVDLARALLSDKDLIVFDEFTSVVDREVAKTCCQTISKAIRRKDKQFIAVSCHKDIIDYLNPDWIYDTDLKSFFGEGATQGPQNEQLKYTELADLISKKYGEYLGDITI